MVVVVVWLMDVDASSAAMGAVLSQKQGGADVVLAYGSKVFSKTQRNYSTTERELLALVHFMQEYRHYLLGSMFLVRTDHAALRWLQSMKEPNGRRARWLESLAEFRFSVVHRPGLRHGNADALSRCPGQASSAERPDISCSMSLDCSLPLSPGDLAERQRADIDLSTVLSWHDGESFCCPPEDALAGCSRAVQTYASEMTNLLLCDGVLYHQDRTATPPHLQLCVPEAMRMEVIEALHAGPAGGHLGGDKTLSQCQQRFFWPGMPSDVKSYVLRCTACAKYKSAQHSTAPLQPMAAGYPCQLVAIDLVGPIHPSSDGHRYILVCIDYFTCWPEAYALHNMSAETVASTFVNEWVSRYGCPEQLHSDQGRQMESTLFAAVCEKLGIRKTRTTPYHPAGDGRVERLNRTIVGALRAHVQQSPQCWNQFLPIVLMAYRTAEHSSTGFTPSKLMFGRELRLPADVVYGLPPEVTPTSPSEYVAEMDKILRHTFHNARKNATCCTLLPTRVS